MRETERESVVRERERGREKEGRRQGEGERILKRGTRSVKEQSERSKEGESGEGDREI